MIVSHFIMHNSEGSVIHGTEHCPAIPHHAHMGAAMDLVTAVNATDIPMCGACCADGINLREAVQALVRLGYTDEYFTDPKVGKCYVCQRTDGSHQRVCLVPILSAWADAPEPDLGAYHDAVMVAFDYGTPLPDPEDYR